MNTSYIQKNHSSLYTSITKRGLQHLYLLAEINYNKPKSSKSPKPFGYWTDTRILEDALKYNNKKDWRTSSSAYSVSLKKKELFKRATAHMAIIKKPSGYWTDARILEDALKYNNKKDWSKNSTAYQIALKNNNNELFEKCTAHMEEIIKPNGYWKYASSNILLEEARKYKTRSEWKKKSPTSYKTASERSELYKRATAHMIIRGGNLPLPGYWTDERILEEATKYKTRSEWVNKSPQSNREARKNKDLYKRATAHMILLLKPPGYWKNHPDRILEDAIKYKTKSEWCNKSSGAHGVAMQDTELYKRATAHMISSRKPKSYWTDDRILEVALKYFSKSEWKEKSPGTQKIARKNKDLYKRATAHMIKL